MHHGVSKLSSRSSRVLFKHVCYEASADLIKYRLALLFTRFRTVGVALFTGDWPLVWRCTLFLALGLALILITDWPLVWRC